MKLALQRFATAFAMAFLPVLLIHRVMESMGHFDAIGWWYSIYGACLTTGAVAAVYAVIMALAQRNS
jgi:hypothetical protein